MWEIKTRLQKQTRGGESVEREQTTIRLPVVEVNGEQVFTADFVFKQMQAQSRRIDRIKNTQILSIVCGILAGAITAILLHL